MIVKIVGFRVHVDRSTCYYKIDEKEGLSPKEWEQKLGHYMYLALQKSDFVSVRK